MNPSVHAIVRAIAGGQSYGMDIARSCRLKPNAVYPVLAQLEENGWVTGEWQDPGAAARRLAPRRRLYRMTPSGAALARRLTSSGTTPRPGMLDSLLSISRRSRS